MGNRESGRAAGILVAALLLLAPGARAQGSTAQLLAAERDLAAAAASRGLAAALPDALGAAGIYLHPGAPVLVGAEAVRAFLGSQPALAELRVTWEAQHAEVSSDAAFGVTWGVSAATVPGQPVRLGRFLAAWRRDEGAWRLAALALVGGALPAADAALLPPALARFHPPAGTSPWAVADRAFAELAGRRGAAEAFRAYAAPDAVTFSSSGLLNRGPGAIHRALAGFDAEWRWHPVADGGSAAGDLGFTVGEAVITARLADGSTRAGLSKYLSLWRRTAEGIRFLADGGSARPGPAGPP
jgi:ketosteroid isomerase-like protein